jgi:hypothetical protein
MNPTAKSAPVGVTCPDDGEVLDLDIPAATSSGFVVEMPENS